MGGMLEQHRKKLERGSREGPGPAQAATGSRHEEDERHDETRTSL
jgi:hypothetical protein